MNGKSDPEVGVDVGLEVMTSVSDCDGCAVNSVGALDGKPVHGAACGELRSQSHAVARFGLQCCSVSSGNLLQEISTGWALHKTGKIGEQETLRTH